MRESVVRESVVRESVVRESVDEAAETRSLRRVPTRTVRGGAQSRPGQAEFIFSDEAEERIYADEAHDPMLGDRFQIWRQVAEGGMGRIFEAIRRSDGRHVALKVLRRELAACARSRRLMLREAQALALASHPRIVELFHYGETDDGLPYLVLEWLEGRSLHQALGDDGPFHLPRVRLLFGQLLDALEVLHVRGIVHADLKPENCMLVTGSDGREELRLVDFGVSSLLRDEAAEAGEVHGTPGYLSPERLRGGPPTPASDLYAAGVVLFELLTGQLPFKLAPLAEMLEQQLRVPLPRASLYRRGSTPALDEVIARALAPEPLMRFADIDELREAFFHAVAPGRHRRHAPDPRATMAMPEAITQKYRRLAAVR